MKQKAFTLIEMLIALVIVCTVILVVIGATSETSSYSYGVNGITETRCINGMQFVVGQSGSVQQILGPNGGGIQCQ